jgi:DNA invertase Pin-like site-specific DNA recombinase
MNRSEAARLMGSARTPAKMAAARENGKLGGRPPGNTIRIKGQLIEVVRKFHAGLKATHNRDGRYNLVWAITADGHIYRTYGRRGGTWRETRAGEIPPPALTA